MHLARPHAFHTSALLGLTALLLLVSFGVVAAGPGSFAGVSAAPPSRAQFDPAFPLESMTRARPEAAALPRAEAAPRDEIQLLANPVSLFPNPAFPGGFYGWGRSVSAAGDVNRDGYADFLCSNKLSDPFGRYGVALYLGSSGGPVSPPAWHRLTFTKPATVSAAGDVNGDGYDDVVLGAADTSGTGAGTIEVWLGSASGLGTSPHFTQTGGSSFGWSVCTAGDVNGDGYDDVIVGEPLAGCSAGAATLYYGSSAGLSAGSSWTASAPLGCNGRFAMTVAGLGDINGDGFDDLGIGSETRQISMTTSPGRAYLGSNSGPVFSPSHSREGSYACRLAPAGDVNGDGYADYWIADPYFVDPSGNNTGFSAILHGGAGGITGGSLFNIGALDHYGILCFTAGDVNGDGLGDALRGRQYDGGPAYLQVALGHLGGQARQVQEIVISEATELGDFSACAAGDVNGDGFGDVLIGIPEDFEFGSGAGKVVLYYGRPDPPPTNPTTERFGGEAGAVSGWSVATGDVNGDGFDDVLVGEPLADEVGYTDNGTIKLYMGGQGGIAATPIWTGIGLNNNANGGISVALGQDINGDGYGDVVVGSHGIDYVMVWFGRADWSTAINFPDQILSGDQPGSQFGASVAYAGDVDGDGFADVVVGAPNYQTASGIISHLIPHPQAGYAFLYRGSAFGLVFGGWGITDNQDWAREGTSVAGAGDVNADGYGDVVIGTGSWDTGVPDQGHARLYLGGPGGLSPTPQRTWEGAGASNYFGQSVAGLGDFDGDGYGDIAIGAFNAGSGGKAYVVRGGATGAEAAPSWEYTGPSAGDAFGSAVSTAGDVNGDGYADLLVGEVFGDGGGFFDCGHAYVFLGAASPLTSSYATFTGVADFDNLGHAVAGGGDVNGDGFGDLVIGEPRRNNGFFDEGVFRLYQGNWRIPFGGGTGTGRGRPVHATQPGPPVVPIAVYGKSRSPSMFGLKSMASSAGGRDQVALDWRVVPPVGAGGAQQGRTAWKQMNPPTDPLVGAALVSHTVGGLAAGSVFGWKARVLSRSPWFRYGSWISPQPNARGQWDVRTAPGTTAAPLAALPAGIELSPAWPNPSAGVVNCSFTLPRAMSARLVVRDLQGRLVRELADHETPAGRHTMRWRGDDASGRPCAAGLYFLELAAGNERRAGRVVIVR